MIEEILRDYLLEALDVPVYLQRQEDKQAVYLVIEKTGSSQTNHLPTATVAIQSYAPTLYGAAALNQELIGVMEDAVSLDVITAVRLNSDYNFTDTASKTYRYQAVFVLTYYKEVTHG